MDEFPINPADAAVIAVVLLSALLAFARGLVREVLSIAGWVGATFAAIWAFPHVRPYAREFVSIELLADAIAAVAVFVVVLVAISLVSHRFARGVRGSALSALDRSLGFVFGAFRGAVVVCLAYLFVVWLWTPEERPPWLAEARTLPLVAAGSEALRGLVPDETRSAAAVEAEAAREQARRAKETGETLQRLMVPRAAGADPAAPQGGSGYDDGDRSNLNRLFEAAE